MAAFIPGPAGRLEALYRPAEAPPAARLPSAALVCHPHPGHGGTMHNKVVYRLARGLLESGLAVLRFNFRGVGLSEGERAPPDGPRGPEVPERQDIAAALDHLAALHPGADLLLAGFSFGAWHGLAVGTGDARVTRFVAAGLPVGVYPPEAWDAAGRPALFLLGEDDPFASPSALRDFARRWGGPADVTILRGADHFFEPRVVEVTEAVRRHLANPPASGAYST